MSPYFLTRRVSRLLGMALVAWAFARVGVHRPSLRLPYLSVFYSLFFTCHWISFVYFLRWRYLHPTTNPPPYSRLGTGTMVIGYPKRLRYHGGGVITYINIIYYINKCWFMLTDVCKAQKRWKSFVTMMTC